MARREWDSLSGAAANHVIGPEALRCPELHDFNDWRRVKRHTQRPVVIVMVLITLLTLGRFAFHELNATAAPVAEQQLPPAAG